jgi:hypothetical protein
MRATPRTLRLLLAFGVLLPLGRGVLGGWAASEHSAAAGSVVSVDESLSLDARQLYQSLAVTGSGTSAGYDALVSRGVPIASPGRLPVAAVMRSRA